MKWIKKWLGVTALDARIKKQEAVLAILSPAIDEKIRDLDKLTREDWDIGMRGPSTIILTGVYRGKGYVKFYEVPGDQFHSLVQEYQERHKHHLIRNVDVPYPMSGAFQL